MKLKLIPPLIVKTPAKTLKPLTGYESPIGWWRVSTEGDCEGRSTNYLGDFYGHVAEIAFHLADKSYYELSFNPIMDRPIGSRNTLQASKDRVSIQLGIDSKTWNLKGADRQKWFVNWLDCPDVEVFKANSYAGITIKLK